ncbi:molybdenum cofactor guanylyltransferase MobA [Paracoccus aurantiacus]|uniref:Molybdenum cofactor guanylyltransferase n=1 Tax=Paracoccus aurantiacus TaxID=2599412 RepID=A0A5C6S9E0_9RHOB|nr:molybdenum cofactor guanylyltransferase MobA [Paracoccus aurantiacus]TXB71018.1 molybdenum cofactor guanylyltransferase MobA [Paracoccus aurantiacus]
MIAPPPAVILAGGRARRMGGGDKVLLDLCGKPLLAHVIDRMQPQCGEMAISANGDATRFAAFGLPVLPDAVPDFPGPLAGILAGMEWAAARGAKVVISVAGDTPFLPATLIQALAEVAGPDGLALAAERVGENTRTHPVIGQWPVSLRHPLHEALLRGERKIMPFAQAHGARTTLFDADDTAFLNINTPQDLSRAVSAR